MLESIDVLCVNCHNFIETSQIDSHSLVCTRVTRQLILAESAGELTEVNFKLDRMRLNIEATLRNKALESDSRIVFERLLELTTQLLDMSLPHVAEVRRINVFLQSFIRDFDGEIYCLLYLERFYLMSSVPPMQTKLRELLEELSRNEQQQALHVKLDLKKKQLEAYKLEIEYLKVKSKRMQEALKLPDSRLQESFVESITGTEPQ